MHGLVKIGRTASPPEDRAAELSAETGVPVNFRVSHHRFTAHCEEAEEAIHEKLTQYRISPAREFFAVNLEQARQVVDTICSEADMICVHPNTSSIAFCFTSG
jgi:hypothetical protein